MSTVDTAEVATDIRNYIRDRFKVPEQDPDFTDDVHIFDYGYVDSFGAVELTQFVESTFSVEVTEADMIVHPLNTVNEIAGFVVRRKTGTI